MLDLIRGIPADYFLHLFGSMLLYLHLRHVYDDRTALCILVAFSFGKEMYDFIYTTGWSWRDIAMNALGVSLAILVLYCRDYWEWRKKRKKYQNIINHRRPAAYRKQTIH